MILYFFFILIECLGLKEEMGIEDVFDIILNIYEFWGCILIVIGIKKDELWNEKFCIKVR